ncbi:MAG: OB-fold nucleic acid binding domain-containing protein, partial [Candidatus Micrarchaeaceae archaeon]
MGGFLHIADAPRHTGSEIKLRGWIHRKRESGSIVFVILRDNTGIIQCAVKRNNVDGSSWSAAGVSTVESSVELSGVVREDQRAPTGYEVEVNSFKATHVSEPYPITEYQSTELLL